MITTIESPTTFQGLNFVEYDIDEMRMFFPPDAIRGMAQTLNGNGGSQDRRTPEYTRTLHALNGLSFHGYRDLGTMLREKGGLRCSEEAILSASTKIDDKQRLELLRKHQEADTALWAAHQAIFAVFIYSDLILNDQTPAGVTIGEIEEGLIQHAYEYGDYLDAAEESIGAREETEATSRDSALRERIERRK